MKSLKQLSAVLLISILEGIEIDLFIPSFPQLQSLFHLTPFLVELILSVNFCAYCISSLLTGYLGDRYGRKPVIVAGLITFMAGSLLCTLTTSHFSQLIFGIFLQGIGIAGPSVLAFVVIADTYSVKQQQRLIGIISGLVSLSMSFSPVLGSYITLFFGWRGNAITLLVLGVFSLLVATRWLPNKPQKIKPSYRPSLSFIKEYRPLLRSSLARYYVVASCCLDLTYWIFVGMAPILYIENMGVTLSNFGYYQGALATVYSIISLFSSRFLNTFGEKRCIHIGLVLCSISLVSTIILGSLNVTDPLLITGSLLFFCAGMVFPGIILYPMALSAIPHSKGRMAAMILASRLLLTAVGLETVSYFHEGTYRPTAMVISVSMILAFYAIVVLVFKKEIFSEKSPLLARSQQ